MLRFVTLGLALLVLVGACALGEPPGPAGTRPIAARIRNGASQPAEISVTVPTGVLPDAVRPSVVAPGTTADVTIHVPTSGEWEIAFNTHATFASTRPGIARLISEGCPLFEFEIIRDSISLGCVR